MLNLPAIYNAIIVLIAVVSRTMRIFRPVDGSIITIVAIKCTVCVRWHKWAPQRCRIGVRLIAISMNGCSTWIVVLETIANTFAAITFVFMLRWMNASNHFYFHIVSHSIAHSRTHENLFAMDTIHNDEQIPLWVNRLTCSIAQKCHTHNSRDSLFPLAAVTTMRQRRCWNFSVTAQNSVSRMDFCVTMGARRRQNKIKVTRVHDYISTFRWHKAWLSFWKSKEHKRIAIIGRNVGQIDR